MKEIDDFEGFEASEIAYIIELLAAMSTTDEIKRKFADFSGGSRTVSSKTIQKISLRFAKKIRERNEAYLRNVEGNPLAHLRVRLDILHRIVEDSLIQRPSHSVKVGEDNYEVVTKADNPSAINAVKLAMTDMNKREELDMKKKDGQEQQFEGDFEIDNGVA